MTKQFSSSRFLLWERPEAYPFYDVINRSSEGPVFDLSVELDSYDGSLYLKAEHVIEMARSLGMATIDEVEKLLAENLTLKEQINRLPEAQEELKSGINGAVHRFYNDLRGYESDLADAISEAERFDRESKASERETIGFIDL